MYFDKEPDSNCMRFETKKYNYRNGYMRGC